MRNRFQRLLEKLGRWMQGRNGLDELSRFLSYAALAIMLLSLIPVLRLLSILAFALLIWSYFRCFSKNIGKRQRERAVYLKISGKIKKFFTRQKNKWRDRKTHRYIKCKGCKTVLRVPKGKGKITFKCPKCQAQIHKKT